MFGRMMIEPLMQVDPAADLQTAVAALIAAAGVTFVAVHFDGYGDSGRHRRGPMLRL